jgi:protein-arginine kinase activator protein McsA
MKDTQKFLENIVQTWTPNMEPEFRGFRCGKCQEYMQQAWHYQLDSAEYLAPVHLCDTCQKEAGIGNGEYKSFQCDACTQEFTEMWHVWTKENGRLVERHYCTSCGPKVE